MSIPHNITSALHESFSSQSAGSFALIERLRSKYSVTPRDQKLGEYIESILRTAVQRRDIENPPSFDNRIEGSGLAIIGGTGTGKSRSIRRYFDKHAALQGHNDPRSSSPLVSVSAPSPCTAIQLARIILAKTGYRLERSYPAHLLWEMVFERLQHLKKFVVHIDELQNVTQHVSLKDKQELANILKNAMEAQRVTLVVSGVDSLYDFLHFDAQIFRRFTIFRFESISPETTNWVANMVQQYASLAELTVDLTSPPVGAATGQNDFNARLSHAALYGYGYSVVLTLMAVERALREDSKSLKPEHYATAFAAKTSCAADRNPFLAPHWHTIDCSRAFEENTSPISPSKRRS